MTTPTQAYHDLLIDIRDNGCTQANERTGKKCTFVLNKTLTYDRLPFVATKKVAIKSAVAEMLGYLKGLTSAADFRKLGTKTWDANANTNEDWLSNPNRSGKDDMGRVYGAQGRSWRSPANSGCVIETDQLKKIVRNLLDHTDDRGEILTFWNPGEFSSGCLRPCMHSHHFSLAGDTLHLTSTQRSADVPLGLPFNMIQTWFLLTYMAWLTGLKVGSVTHHIVNAHIYEDQWEGVHTQIGRIVSGLECENYNEGRDFIFFKASNPAMHGTELSWAMEEIENVTLFDIEFPELKSMNKIDFPFTV